MNLAKLKARIRAKPRDFKWSELVVLLKALGFREVKTGKTGGSRCRFYHAERQIYIRLHRPHPKPILKLYQINDIVETLTREGLL